MHSRRLILAGARHYWRTHLSVLIGCAIGAAVLTGALIVGDSVRHTLREHALARIGRIDDALIAGDRFFQTSLAQRLTDRLGTGHIAPALIVRGVVSTSDGARLARDVNVIGVDERFFGFALVEGESISLSGSDVLANERLTARLALTGREEIVLRVEQPSALPRDSVLGTVEDVSTALRVTVIGSLGSGSLGRFSLSADQIPPYNLFVDITWLQAQLGIGARANAMLVSTDAGVEALNDAIDALVEPGDLQLQLAGSGQPDITELRSERIFLDPVIEEAATGAAAPMTAFLTYFVNAIEHGDRMTPYSIVSAYAGVTQQAGTSVDPLPEDLADDAIVINQWLADDLQCHVGDALRLRYFVLDDNDRLAEESSTFTVTSIVPIDGLAGDRSLMPEFPGIADAESSRDWQPGIPIDLGLIRQKDEDYWNTHRGTPKAFISLAAGKRMWENRYGGLTSVRFPSDRAAQIEQHLNDTIDPRSLGLFFRDVRAPALAASRATTDFGGLFLGLSIFLIVASLLLTALLFVFNIEQRAKQIGTLLAIGFRPPIVRRLLLGEGLAIALIGSAAGAVVAVGYTRAVLSALAGVWSDAVASASIELHVTPLTLVMGALASTITALIAMRLALGRIVRIEPVSLLAGDLISGHHAESRPRHLRLSMPIVVIGLLGAAGIVVFLGDDPRSAATAFFSAGAMLLLAGIGGSHLVLRRLRRPAEQATTSVRGLAIRNTTRRLTRSLTTVSLLASGVFLVLAIAVNQLDANQGADERDSGTGGFALIGASTLPVHLDLNEQRGRDAFGLTDAELAGVSFVSMRVRDGDDASCLNLNTAQSPRLLGVEPAALAGRGAFRFVKVIEGANISDGWALLNMSRPDGAIPAVADDTSATWAMHKSVGDTIEYVDDRGRTFDVVIVGTIGASILQGSLLIAADHFQRAFPSEGGGRAFLIDAPKEGRDALAARLQRAMSDVGLELTPAPQRLADYNAVQNTYLRIFQMLGGLGLLLGTIGLGVVVVRNALERRGELALFRALGFNLRQIRRLLIEESTFILLLGLLAGTLAALVAVFPAIRSGATHIPIGFSIAVLIAIILNGVFWIWLATRLAVSNALIEALRNE